MTTGGRFARKPIIFAQLISAIVVEKAENTGSLADQTIESVAAKSLLP
jgi:hypothetical protein